MEHSLMGRKIWRGRDDIWVYSLLEAAMADAGLQEMETYIPHHQDIVIQFIVTRPIMDLCLTEERRLGSRVTNWWWEQDGLYVEGMQTAAQDVEWTEGE